jgi:hypothetical protein
MTHTRTTTLVLAVLALGAGAVVTRAWMRAPRLEQPVVPMAAAPVHLQAEVVDPDFSPARSAEARAAVSRAFGNAVAVVQDEAAVGDFNGDGSPDLALAVRAGAGQAAAVADPLANWTVQDCVSPPARHPVAHPAPAPIVDREPLLAVLHGNGSRGWRDPEARQAYVVRTGLEGAWGARPRDAYPSLAPPPGRGIHDVLAAARAGGVVYWAGGRYACSGPARSSAVPVAVLP